MTTSGVSMYSEEVLKCISESNLDSDLDLDLKIDLDHSADHDL